MTVTNIYKFGELSPQDYKDMGFKSGLEVHQQLLTKSKLFCRCPAGRYSNKFDAEILRHMRPTLSEMGEYDGTALMEYKTKKNIIYKVNYETTCTYEMDDTPPFQIDHNALDICMEIALLHNCNLVGEVHIIRKQYLDGSIPTGFQRTAIVAVSGSIPYEGTNIGIRQISLEEDSCRELGDNGHFRYYNTDRLGMPLIEIVTEPDMFDPWSLEGVGQLIRRTNRATSHVRTGMGAGRQDVNVSAPGGIRVEIKGVPRLKEIPHLVHNEFMRQIALVNLRDELKRRGVEAKDIEGQYKEVSSVLENNSFIPIKRALAEGDKIYAVALKGFAGLLNEFTQEETRFVDEFSDRVRVIACLDEMPNIVSSDTDVSCLSNREWRTLQTELNATDKDTLMLVWGNSEDVVTGAKEIVIRAQEALESCPVPGETRQALSNGNNRFERILPGPDRMYPDTDRPPIRVTEDRVARIEAELPEPPWVYEEKFAALGIPEDTIIPLAASRLRGAFERAVEDIGTAPTLAATVIAHNIKHIERKNNTSRRIKENDLLKLFDALSTNKIYKEAIPIVLDRFVSGKKSMDKVIEKFGVTGKEEVQLDEIRSAVKSSLAELDFTSNETKLNYTIGLLRKFRGRVEISQLLEVARGIIA